MRALPFDHDDARAAHLVALATMDGIGPATLLRCHAGDPVAIWSAVAAGHGDRVPELAGVQTSPQMLRAEAAGVDPLGLLVRHRADGRQVLVLGEPGYPERLLDDPAPPALLFAVGDLPVLAGPTVAIVGTRNATRQGRDVAARLGGDLARAGVSVVSGLALGIDGAAHVGTIEAVTSGAVGRPVGVIASGLDVTYPSRHGRLHQEVARQGLLLTETPLGHRPTAWRFPARNRIIAGLADAVVVVESRSAGGSMLTAGEALARATPLLAVPGHPGAPASAGTNDLIYDGATLLRDVEDVLVAIGRGGTSRAARRTHDLEPDARWAGPEAAVLDALAGGPRSLDEIVDGAELDLGTVSVALTSLEAAGAVTREGPWFERKGS